ncbi:MAG: hypothetical protein IJW01_00705 [Paludibacteraceae bacterium]|nr:hypothetical protein [Paludibacteraceae bacterium]
MAKINGVCPGVTAELDYKGNIKSFTVNIKKCNDTVKEFFQGLGYQLEKSPYDPKFVKKIKESEKGPFYEINIDDYL